MSTVAAPRSHRAPTVAVVRLRALQRQPVLYGAMSVYAVAAIGVMAARRVGLTAEHEMLMALLVFGMTGRAGPSCGSGCPSSSSP